VLAIVVSRKLGWNYRRVFAWAAVLLFLAFLPSCGAVMAVLDQYRFGVFEYTDYHSVDDLRTKRYLPEPAKAITIEKTKQGYRAKFKIDNKALDQWFDQSWKKSDKQAPFPRSELEAANEEDSKVTEEWIAQKFGDLGWPAFDDAQVYEGPKARNGAGYTIWFSTSSETAYQEVGYW